MEKQRGLSDEFMMELKDGFLKPLLDFVKKDDTLLLQIRNNYINIYYRGGSLLKLEETGNNYKACFDENYFKEGKVYLPNIINNNSTIKEWIDKIPNLKQCIDEYFSLIKNSSEREFQQLVARENSNSIISNSTDYFVTDIEYANSSIQARFDIIAIKWISSVAARKKTENCRLALIEMKFADNALTGNSGLVDHINKAEIFCSNKENLNTLKLETITVFEQLRTLGLIKFSKNGNENKIKQLHDEKPEFIFLLANHDPATTTLKKIINEVKPMENAELKFATSSFMGYGLYEENIINLAEFKRIINK